jgi:hypothetical protein
VVFGLAALLWPGTTLRILVWLYGFYAVVDGLLALAALIVGDRLASGRRGRLIAAISDRGLDGRHRGAGGRRRLHPAPGTARRVAARPCRDHLGDPWHLLAVRPGEGAIAIVWATGLYAIVFGVALLLLGVRLRRLQNRINRIARP